MHLDRQASMFFDSHIQETNGEELLCSSLKSYVYALLRWRSRLEQKEWKIDRVNPNLDITCKDFRKCQPYTNRNSF